MVISQTLTDSKDEPIKDPIILSGPTSGASGTVFPPETESTGSDRESRPSLTPASSNTEGLSEFQFSLSQEKIIQKLEMDILREIENHQFEDGFEHPSERVIRECLFRYPAITKRWLQQTFLRNYKYPEVLVAILRTIADFDCSFINPECEILSIAALAHKNQEIRETAIAAFETWGTRDSITFLENYNETVPWLQRYRQKVIETLRRKHGLPR